MLRVTVRRAPPLRAVGFDLENRPAAYWFDGQTTSEITAFAWKWSDERQVHSMLLQPDGTFMDDEGICAPAVMAYDTFLNELACAGLVYGHNIRRHDLPMLNAGLLRLELPPLPPLLTTDTCRDLPKRAGLSYSLENLVAMYGIKGAKFKMSQPDWEAANRLTESGRKLAQKRVTSDVLLQERLRNKLLELGILRAPRPWSP